MNCRPGDIAIFVHSETKNLGGMVRIIRPTPACFKDHSLGFEWEAEALSRLWCSQAGKWLPPGANGDVPDAYLRPLRGDLSQSDVDALYAAPKRTEVV